MLELPRDERELSDMEGAQIRKKDRHRRQEQFVSEAHIAMCKMKFKIFSWTKG